MYLTHEQIESVFFMNDEKGVFCLDRANPLGKSALLFDLTHTPKKQGWNLLASAANSYHTLTMLAGMVKRAKAVIDSIDNQPENEITIGSNEAFLQMLELIRLAQSYAVHGQNAEIERPEL